MVFRPANYSITGSVVNFKCSFMIDSGLYLDRLPFQIGKINGDFTDLMGALKTLEGCPTIVDNIFDISDNSNITSFEFFPAYAKSINISSTAITSLIGISDVIKSMNGPFTCYSTEIVEGGLGLLQIDGCTALECDAESEPLSIIAKYISKGEDGLIECQSELIEAGYEEYAQL